MQRINLGRPYEEFIRNQIEAGFFGSSTEVIRDALRTKMAEAERNRIAHIRALIAEAEESVAEGRVTKFSRELMDEIAEKAIQNAKDGKEVKSIYKPC